MNKRSSLGEHLAARDGEVLSVTEFLQKLSLEVCPTGAGADVLAHQRRGFRKRHGNDGRPVTNTVTLTLAPGAQIRARGESIFGLPDPAIAVGITEGSVAVTVDGPGVIGDVTFGDAINESFVESLPLDGSPASNSILSQVAQGSAGGGKFYFTGIAMFNPNSDGVNVTLEVHSEKGNLTGKSSFILPGGNRVSKTLPQLVPEKTDQMRGFIRISSEGGPIVVFELFGDQSLQFLAAIPPQSITP